MIKHVFSYKIKNILSFNFFNTFTDNFDCYIAEQKELSEIVNSLKNVKDENLKTELKKRKKHLTSSIEKGIIEYKKELKNINKNIPIFNKNIFLQNKFSIDIDLDNFLLEKQEFFKEEYLGHFLMNKKDFSTIKFKKIKALTDYEFKYLSDKRSRINPQIFSKTKISETKYISECIQKENDFFFELIEKFQQIKYIIKQQERLGIHIAFLNCLKKETSKKIFNPLNKKYEEVFEVKGDIALNNRNPYLCHIKIVYTENTLLFFDLKRLSKEERQKIHDIGLERYYQKLFKFKLLSI